MSPKSKVGWARSLTLTLDLGPHSTGSVSPTDSSTSPTGRLRLPSLDFGLWTLDFGLHSNAC